jgi:methionyl aminopeptidase
MNLRTVPPHIIRPDYAMPGAKGKPKSYAVDSKGRRKVIKNELKGEPLQRMRRAGRAAREVLEEVLSAVRPGVTTEALDVIAHEASIERGGYPSPLGYRGFPKSLCTSINEVICHGIPEQRVLKDGDVINCDVTLYIDGMHGDCSETVFVGTPSPEAQKLVEFTYRSLMSAIDVVQPGKKLNEIGRKISRMANKEGYSVVRDFSGHGIGPVFHMPPSVVHYYERHNMMRIKEGMVFTIEPMINVGAFYADILPDDWTAVTLDGSLSAQFEHTIYVGKRGAEILTGGTPFFKDQLNALTEAKGATP